jgi:hypothetical protein
MMILSVLAGTTINASPNANDVPGATQLQQLLSGAMWLGMVGCVAAIVLGGLALGLGRHAGNPHWAERGKVAAVGGFVGAFLIGAATALVTFAFALGSQVSGG